MFRCANRWICGRGGKAEAAGPIAVVAGEGFAVGEAGESGAILNLGEAGGGGSKINRFSEIGEPEEEGATVGGMGERRGCEGGWSESKKQDESRYGSAHLSKSEGWYR